MNRKEFIRQVKLIALQDDVEADSVLSQIDDAIRDYRPFDPTLADKMLVFKHKVVAMHEAMHDVEAYARSRLELAGE